MLWEVWKDILFPAGRMHFKLTFHKSHTQSLHAGLLHKHDFFPSYSFSSGLFSEPDEFQPHGLYVLTRMTALLGRLQIHEPSSGLGGEGDPQIPGPLPQHTAREVVLVRSPTGSSVSPCTHKELPPRLMELWCWVFTETAIWGKGREKQHFSQLPASLLST